MSPLHPSRFSLATFLKIVLIVGALATLLWYGHFQARFFLDGPQVTLLSPSGTLHHERVIPVAGTAKNITDITLNGKQIYTDEDGNFTESLVLENGYTIMTVEVRDRYGRTSTLSRGLVYEGGV